MRTITQKSVNAFNNNENFNLSNTKVTVKDGQTSLFLFDNLIAKKDKEGVFITNSGWMSKTTKERLNGLDNVNISQKKGVWYLNGEKWDGNLTKI